MVTQCLSAQGVDERMINVHYYYYNVELCEWLHNHCLLCTNCHLADGVRTLLAQPIMTVVGGKMLRVCRYTSVNGL